VPFIESRDPPRQRVALRDGDVIPASVVAEGLGRQQLEVKNSDAGEAERQDRQQPGIDRNGPAKIEPGRRVADQARRAGREEGKRQREERRAAEPAEEAHGQYRKREGKDADDEAQHESLEGRSSFRKQER
jgi:hypothetical protein